MRLLTGGVAHVAGVVERDLCEREVGLRKQHVEALADVVAPVRWPAATPTRRSGRR